MRFPGFTDEWKTDRLSSYAKKIIRKNKGHSITNVLCNSANLGIIPQSEYFDRDIANSENTNAYYVIECGDFVYNPRKSVSAPYGPVNLYDRPESGIISPLYLCFRVKNISKDFLLRWFKGNSWHKYVYSHGDTGVRYDRVSIKDEIFLNMPILLPSIPEQEKIAKFLSLLDERIATQNKIIEDLQSLIKGLAKTLTNQGEPNTRISNCLDCHTSTLQEGSLNKKSLYPVYGASGIAGFLDDYICDKDSILIIKDGSGAGTVSFATGQYSVIGTLNYLTAKSGYSLKYLYFCLMSFNFEPFKTGMAIPHIYFKDYGRAKIYCPSIAEQQCIAKTLTVLENKLNIELKLLNILYQEKRCLLSKMFI